MTCKANESAFANYIIPGMSVTSTGDFRIGWDEVCCFSLTGAKCGFRVCVKRDFRSAALGDEKRFYCLFSVRRAGPKTRPF
jgi:hypothetical protein